MIEIQIQRVCLYCCFLFLYSSLALQVVVFLVPARIHTLLLPATPATPACPHTWALLQAQEHVLKIL